MSRFNDLEGVKLKICILEAAELKEPLNRPYVVLKNGRTFKRTNADRSNDGIWNETFDVPVTTGDRMELSLRQEAFVDRNLIGIGYVRGTTLLDRRGDVFWVHLRSKYGTPAGKLLISVDDGRLRRLASALSSSGSRTPMRAVDRLAASLNAAAAAVVESPRPKATATTGSTPGSVADTIRDRIAKRAQESQQQASSSPYDFDSIFGPPQPEYYYDSYRRPYFSGLSVAPPQPVGWAAPVVRAPMYSVPVPLGAPYGVAPPLSARFAAPVSLPPPPPIRVLSPVRTVYSVPSTMTTTTTSLAGPLAASQTRVYSAPDYVPLSARTDPGAGSTVRVAPIRSMSPMRTARYLSATASVPTTYLASSSSSPYREVRQYSLPSTSIIPAAAPLSLSPSRRIVLGGGSYATTSTSPYRPIVSTGSPFTVIPPIAASLISSSSPVTRGIPPASASAAPASTTATSTAENVTSSTTTTSVAPGQNGSPTFVSSSGARMRVSSF